MRAAPMREMLLLAGFSTAALGAGLGRGVVTTYLPVLLSRIEDAPGLIGTVMLVNVASGLLVPPLVGVWSDRGRAAGHGRTGFVAAGSLLAALGLVAVALAHATVYPLLALCALVAYTGLNTITTAHRTLIAESFPPRARARATGAEELALLGGGLLGVAGGGALLERHGWSPFAAAAVLVGLLAIPTVAAMRRREAPPAAVPPTGHVGPAYFLRVACRPGVRLVIAAQGLWVLGYAALPTFFVLYAERVLGLGTAEAGLWLVVFGVVTGAAMLAAGAAKDDDRHLTLLVAGVVAMSAGFAAMAPASSVLEAAPGLIAAAAGFGVLSTVGFPLYSSLIPPGEVGAYTAVFFAVRSVAGAVALPAVGWAIQISGTYRTLLVVGAVATAGALVPLTMLARARGARMPRPVLTPPPLRWSLRWLAGLLAATAVTAGLGLVVARTPMAAIDEAVFRAVHAMRPRADWVDRLLVSPDFRNYAVLAVAGAVAGWLARPRIPLHGALLAALAGVVSFLCVRVIWLAWERPRPEEVITGITVGDHLWAPYPSFPSGHVVVTVAMVVVVARLAPPLAVPLWAFTALIGVTRVMAGAHFPTDVVLGAGLGVVAARFAYALAERVGIVGPWTAPRDVPRSAQRRDGDPDHVADRPERARRAVVDGGDGHP